MKAADLLAKIKEGRIPHAISGVGFYSFRWELDGQTVTRAVETLERQGKIIVNRNAYRARIQGAL